VWACQWKGIETGGHTGVGRFDARAPRLLSKSGRRALSTRLRCHGEQRRWQRIGLRNGTASRKVEPESTRFKVFVPLSHFTKWQRRGHLVKWLGQGADPPIPVPVPVPDLPGTGTLPPASPIPIGGSAPWVRRYDSTTHTFSKKKLAAESGTDPRRLRPGMCAEGERGLGSCRQPARGSRWGGVPDR
jgi:hypothetical protein